MVSSGATMMLPQGDAMKSTAKTAAPERPGKTARRLHRKVRSAHGQPHPLGACCAAKAPSLREPTGLRQLQLLRHRLLLNRTSFGLHRLNGGKRKGNRTLVLLRLNIARSHRNTSRQRQPKPVHSHSESRGPRKARNEALIAAAILQAKTPLPAKGTGHLIIKSISAKQRPRRLPEKPARTK